MTTLLSLPEDVRIAAYPFLAESILLVHKHAPARWGLSPKTSDGFIRLNLVMTEVLAIEPDYVGVLVNGDMANEIPAVKSGKLLIRGHQDDNGDILASSPGSRLIEVPRGPDQRELLSQLLHAHAENIRITAKRGGLGRGVRSAHRDEAVKEIGLFLGRELPLPLYSLDQQPDEIEPENVDARTEGAQREILSKRRERNAKNRQNAIQFHGLTCKACGFNFEAVYGEHGFGYIHVHHIDALSASFGEVLIDPKKDLTVVCANCHAMLHRNRNKTLTLDELKNIMLRT